MKRTGTAVVVTEFLNRKILKLVGVEWWLGDDTGDVFA